MPRRPSGAARSICRRSSSTGCRSCPPTTARRRRTSRPAIEWQIPAAPDDLEHLLADPRSLTLEWSMYPATAASSAASLRRGHDPGAAADLLAAGLNKPRRRLEAVAGAHRARAAAAALVRCAPRGFPHRGRLPRVGRFGGEPRRPRRHPGPPRRLGRATPGHAAGPRLKAYAPAIVQTGPSGEPTSSAWATRRCASRSTAATASTWRRCARRSRPTCGRSPPDLRRRDARDRRRGAVDDLAYRSLTAEADIASCDKSTTIYPDRVALVAVERDGGRWRFHVLRDRMGRADRLTTTVLDPRAPRPRGGGLNSLRAQYTR